MEFPDKNGKDPYNFNIILGLQWWSNPLYSTDSSILSFEKLKYS